MTHEEAVNAALADMGLPRTRENYLYVLYGGEPLPEEWDAEDEERNVPPDLRVQIT